MSQENFIHILLGEDLRTIRKNGIVVRSVRDQKSFDELFSLIFHHERPLVMRAADAIEKITRKHREYLNPHKQQLLIALKSAGHKELKWHIAQLIPRIELTQEELVDVWHILSYWALNTNESKIVRVNALQGLFDLSIIHADFKNNFLETMQSLAHDATPSIKARIKKIRKIIERQAEL